MFVELKRNKKNLSLAGCQKLELKNLLANQYLSKTVNFRKFYKLNNTLSSKVKSIDNIKFVVFSNSPRHKPINS